MVLAAFLSVLSVVFGLALAQVTELDFNFLEQRKEGLWLVEFYAPWCGHCQRLEPIYNQVYIHLRHTAIKVGKLDCTKHSNVANMFGVKGFPTIKFVKGEDIYTHRGDRTKEDIIKFALKAQMDPINTITSEGKFTEIEHYHHNEVFFMYVGKESPDIILYKKFVLTARRQLIQSYFYVGESRVLPPHVRMTRSPTVLVFKDNLYDEYFGEPSMTELDDWVVKERYLAYPTVTANILNEMVELKKILVITAYNKEDSKNRKINARYEKMSIELALNQKRKFHNQFQFAHLNDSEPLNSITMSTIEMPTLLVYDSESQYYYMPEKEVKDLTLAEYSQFLIDVSEGKVTAQGGTGFTQRLKRIGYDIWSTVLAIWTASRWLFLLMFGLPTVIISVVCYSICCMEPFDQEAALSDAEDEDEDSHKRSKQDGPKPCPKAVPHKCTKHLKSE
ncbi:protein disulfide-isomerase TMX3-like [Octopus vulgaris]|uniref:Protein disulfide-isomerase TMX3-like n=2 Tax=Octopus TaxID=6643 RepID=A0AA36AHJ8_OCTVU|nr:protein disulfide-isomerase TMX3 [Octopus sinensis]CAI9716290.1 protein disulfide-isomerase TMX3-like [Octopus vulgaris]